MGDDRETKATIAGLLAIVLLAAAVNNSIDPLSIVQIFMTVIRAIPGPG